MKKYLFAILLFIIGAIPAFSQTYKTYADTAALNKEYAKVSSNIADLTAKLSEAKNDLAKYTNQSKKASNDAQSTATSTTNKASTAINGSVKDARKAKKEARKSLKNAKGSRKADDKVDAQTKKVNNLSEELSKNQDRLKQLDAMRASINNLVPDSTISKHN